MGMRGEGGKRETGGGGNEGERGGKVEDEGEWNKRALIMTASL